MKVVFRADGAAELGVGHLERCWTLARRIARWHEVTFIGRLPETYLTQFGAAGYKCVSLGEKPDGDLRAIAEFSPDWLVVDHYGLGEAWERAARQHCRRLMVIDDLADRDHDCDVLLDANFTRSLEHRYDSLVPHSATKLLGPSYALLRDEFEDPELKARVRDGLVRQILISLGGADPNRQTIKVISALQQLSNRDVDVTVVAGPANRHHAEIQSATAALPGARYFSSVSNIAELMSAADLAIGGAGTSTWERCALGLPSVLIILAENQRAAAEALHDHGAAVNAGWHEDVSGANLARLIKSLMHDPERLQSISARARQLVPGDGASRVLKAMGLDDLRLRPARTNDAERLLQWRNDPDTRAASVHTAEVTPAEHDSWLARSLANPDRKVFIAERWGEPVGTVRGDRSPAGWELSWTVAPGSRGQGLGVRMLQLLIDALGRPALARIKAGNSPSTKMAEAVGMVHVRDEGNVGIWELR